jgi:hypothetical protein
MDIRGFFHDRPPAASDRTQVMTRNQRARTNASILLAWMPEQAAKAAQI